MSPTRLITPSETLKSRLADFDPKPKNLMLMAVPLVFMRFSFMAFPSVWLAISMWLVAGAIVLGWARILRRRAIPLYGVFLVGLGASANGLVMVANGGAMPVFGMTEELKSGAWLKAEEGGHLLFLADRMSLGGASPGDILIVSGIAFTLVVLLYRGLRTISGRLRPVTS